MGSEIMENRKQVLSDFFSGYEQRFNEFLKGETLEVESTVRSFSACFIEASPLGVVCAPNDLEFRSMISKGYEFYRSAGITAMNILSKDITLLDDLHAMVKVHWNSRFTRRDGVQGAIEFDVIYLLQTNDNLPKIFAYITGDEQTALKENGLID